MNGKAISGPVATYVQGWAQVVISRLMFKSGGSGSGELKKFPPSFFSLLWFMNGCERKPDKKKKDISMDWLNWLMSQYRKRNVAKLFF